MKEIILDEFSENETVDINENKIKE